MKPTIVILAAGLGTRYGGLKQIDPVGPNGELLIDYSVYDALNAGFGKLVFVIRHYFENAFKEKFGGRFGDRAETAYAYQEMDACLDGFKAPADRDKPWGTAHAILVAKDVIDRPFVVINADDYYGPNSFKMMAEFLRGPEISPANYVMVGFGLRNTLSNYGAVSRGVCHCDEEIFLLDVVERKRVEKRGQAACYVDDDGTEHMLKGEEVVSMNLWGFHPAVFAHLSQQFRDFLAKHVNQPKSELYIPSAVDSLVKTGRVKVKVLRTHDNWFGVTYRQDREIAERSIARLIADGVYPEKLWET